MAWCDTPAWGPAIDLKASRREPRPLTRPASALRSCSAAAAEDGPPPTAPLAEGHTVPSVERLKQLAGRAASLVREAVRTHDVQPDRERGWLAQPRSAMPDPANHATEVDSGDYAAGPRWRRQASPAEVSRSDVVMGWLAWLGHRDDNGRRDVEILIARARRRPVWRIAQRWRCSEKTIIRWEAGAYAAIALRFERDIEAME